MIEIKLYNTLTKEKEPLKTNTPGKAKIYSCGPTVYNYNHIGNFRYYVFVDVLRRTLKLLGYQVDHTMNITDIDDKIINNAIKQNVSIEEFTKKWIDAFFEDLKVLKIETLEHYPRATESIPEMMELIEKLEKNKLIYEKEGSIYFSISHFEGYGKLSKIDTSGMMSGVRYDADEYDKNDVRDFVLWKAPKLEGEKFWDTQYGKGRPGWHLECSAMIRKIYGKNGIDIHTGGVDLTFPHHENEIAQSEGAFPNENFVRAWVHCEHLLVENQKMSKSLGNYYTLRDLVAKNYSPKAIRYLLLSFHHRTKLNFSLSRIEECKKSIERMQNTLDRVLEKTNGKYVTTPPTGVAWESYDSFLNDLSDDLNIAKALSEIFELLKTINADLDKNIYSEADLLDITSFFYNINLLLDVLEFEKQEEFLDTEIEKLIQERMDAKAHKDFKQADLIRNKLLSMGIILEDTKTGVKWKRK